MVETEQDDPPNYYAFSQRGGWQTMLNFIVGASLSATAGYAGMYIATIANEKTTEAAKVGLYFGLLLLAWT